MTARIIRAVAALALLLAVATPAAAQPGRISGLIKDDSGRPVPSATVVAENPDGAPDTLTAVADRKGRFAMIGLRPGLWSIRIQAAGHEPLQTSMRVSAVRNTLPIEFRLRKLEEVPPGALDGLDVKTIEAEIASADALLQAGQAEGAITAYRALLTKIPVLTTLNLRIGAACRVKGDDEGALTAYQAAIDTGAAPAKAHLRMAEIAFDRGDAASARVHLEHVVSLAPSSDQAAEARALLARLQH